MKVDIHVELKNGTFVSSTTTDLTDAQVDDLIVSVEDVVGRNEGNIHFPQNNDTVIIAVTEIRLVKIRKWEYGDPE